MGEVKPAKKAIDMINTEKNVKKEDEVGRIIKVIPLTEEQIHSKNIRLVIIMMIIIIVAAFALSFMYTDTTHNIEDAKENNIYNHKEMQFEHIWALLNDHIIPDAEQNISGSASEIESEIKQLDLTALKLDLDAKKYPDYLIDIFRDNLEDKSLNDIDNGKNSIIVISNDHVLVNYSYYLYPTFAEDSKSYSSILQAGYNSALGENALSKLYKHDDAVICTETLSPTNENHIKISESSKRNFKEVYMKEGIDGFKNYQFIVPVYITDTGDIFGQDDIIFGERDNTNHKFIIIQEFNLYDQLVEQYSSYADEDHLDQVEKRYNDILDNMYLIGIFFAAFVAIVLLILVAVYDNITQIHSSKVNKK